MLFLDVSSPPFCLVGSFQGDSGACGYLEELGLNRERHIASSPVERL